MVSLDALFFFISVFSILIILKNIFKFLGTLSQKNPQPLDISGRELFYFGTAISYIITYFYFN